MTETVAAHRLDAIAGMLEMARIMAADINDQLQANSGQRAVDLRTAANTVVRRCGNLRDQVAELTAD